MKNKMLVILGAAGLTLLSGLLIAAVTPPTAPASPPAAGTDLAGWRQSHPGFNPLAVIAQGERLKDQMAEKLQLTNEQRDQLDHLGRDFRSRQREALAAHRAGMRAVLTPEQQPKADELRGWLLDHQALAGLTPQRTGRPAPSPLAVIALAERLKDRIAEKLQLTSEQRDQLEHLGRDFRASQREALKAHLAGMRAVLTPEQQQKADEWTKQFTRQRGDMTGAGDQDGMAPPLVTDATGDLDDA
jgi:Spy/CpxP family protein refolding chaperone